MYIFTPVKSFGQLLDISPKSFVFLKTFNWEFLYIQVWFIDQNFKPLKTEDKHQFNLKIKYLKKAMDLCILLNNMVKNIGKNISENLGRKYSQRFLDQTKQSTADVIKTASKKATQKTVEVTGDLIGNKIADRITKVSKSS